MKGDSRGDWLFGVTRQMLAACLKYSAAKSGTKTGAMMSDKLIGINAGEMFCSSNR